jgi:hypothetical protein
VLKNAGRRTTNNEAIFKEKELIVLLLGINGCPI